MNKPLTGATICADDLFTPPANLGRFARKEGRPQRKTPQLRSYEVAHLTPSNDIETRVITAPAFALCDAACGAMARGTLLRTPHGPVSIGDIRPGDHVATHDRGFARVIWKGAMQWSTRFPGATQLYRFSADRFGLPCDIVLNGHARVFHRSTAITRRLNKDGAMVPAMDLEDGWSVTRISPPGAIEMFQICLSGQARLDLSGLEVESLCLPATHLLNLPPQTAAQLTTMFPHASSMVQLGATSIPRLEPGDLRVIETP